MQSHWRKILSLLPVQLEKKYYNKFFLDEHNKWEENGRHFPVSNLTKQYALRELQKQFNIKTLVETGTYLGDTLFALSSDFATLYSIELSQYYYNLAKKRFKNYPQISLLNGDSSKVLKELVPKLELPTLFWLDGHYSGGLTAKGEKECPVFEELSSIFLSPVEHFIFIDDARLFIGEKDYPTIAELQEFIKLQKPTYQFSVVHDCIRLLPPFVKHKVTQ